MSTRHLFVSATVIAGLAFSASAAWAQKKYDTGASDSEIKIGNIMPYSGPASAYGTIGKTDAAYFKMINDQGGINGRKINFISLDDGYSPPKTVEDARQTGRAGAGAVRIQLPRHAAEYRDPQVHEREEGAAVVRRHRRKQVERSEALPWTMGWQPNYQTEARSTPSTSWKPRRMRKSPCSTRTTITARTT